MQVSLGDATKTLASRIWENWIPFGTETAESEIAVVANARVPLADIFTAGMHRILCSIDKIDSSGRKICKSSRCTRLLQGSANRAILLYNCNGPRRYCHIERPGQSFTASLFEPGKASGTWKLMRPDKLGQVRPCGHVSMRCAWLPAV